MITWLHGLFGAPTDFSVVAQRLAERAGADLKQAAPALPGHMGSPPLDRALVPAFDEVVEAFIASLDEANIGHTALVGYSMGARVAMHVALAHPERVTHLVVIGGHPGIEDPQVRLGRLMLDRKRAARLAGGGMRPFLTTWYEQPLFTGFKGSPGFSEAFEARCRGDADAIATTLERLSTGHQAPLQGPMAACRVPTLWVAGERDGRYVELLKPMADAQKSGQWAAIAGAGHAVHTEAPEALADLLWDFLNERSEFGSSR